MMHGKKLSGIAISVLLLSTSLIVFAPPSVASPSYTDFELTPQTLQIMNRENITISIYVTPQDGHSIDGLSTDLINFSKDTLRCTKVSKGNILHGDEGIEIWMKGTINNNLGTISNVAWSWQWAADTEPGYFVNLSFETISPGHGWVQIKECGAAFQGEELPTDVIHNSSITIYDIIVSDEYPPDYSTGKNASELLKINTTDVSGHNVNVYWYTNATGTWEFLGYNLSAVNGTHQMSCYGIINSPYNQTVSYQFTNYQSGNTTYVSNQCLGANIGIITGVDIQTPGYTGNIVPIFHGCVNGSGYYTSSLNENTTDIYNDDRAPLNWTWDDVKNLNVWLQSYVTPVNVIVTYDLQYGEGLTIYWNVNISDVVSWNNNTFRYTVKKVTPFISDHYPLDGQTTLVYNPTLSVTVMDPNGMDMDVSFYTNASGSWQQVGSTQHGGNGTYNQATTTLNQYSTTYYWRAIANNSETETERYFHFTMRDIQGSPIGFTATSLTESSIRLNWTRSQYSDYTLVKRRVDRYPSFSDPGQIYYGAATNITDSTLLEPKTVYYYSAWAYNLTDNSWSTDNASLYEMTRPGPVADLKAETLDYNQIDLTWTPGEQSDFTVIVRKRGSYPTSITDGTQIYFNSGSQYLDTGGLGGNITYYYRAWAYGRLESPQLFVYYSAGNTSDKNTTFVGPPFPLTLDTDSIGSTFGTLQGLLESDGGELSTVGFYWGNATSHSNVTIGSKVTGQTFDEELSGLKEGSEYYAQAWATNSYGFIRGNNLTWYTTPYKPTNFTATTIDDLSIFLGWTTGSRGADRTYIRTKIGSYPADRSDGSEVYFGPDETFLVRNLTDPTRHEYYTTTTGQTNRSTENLSGTTWISQSITVGNRGTNEYSYLTSLKLNLTRMGWPGQVYVHIRNATNGLPTGNDLYFTSINGDMLDTQFGTYVEMPIDTGAVLLRKGKQYAIIVDAPNGDSSNKVKWGRHFAQSTYSGGMLSISTNSGTTWVEKKGWYYSQYYHTNFQADSDLLFETYAVTSLGLLSNQTYYFKAWSYNDSEPIFSESFSTANATTDPGIPILHALYPIDINDTSLTFRAYVINDNGEPATVGFKYGTSSGVYIHNVTATGTYTDDQTVTRAVSDVTIGTTWYYRAWAKNSAGYSEDFEEHVVTRPETALPFDVNNYGARQLNMTWTKRNGEDYTIIVRSTVHTPTSRTDGVVRYNGTNNWFNDNLTHPKSDPAIQPNTNYYYSTWSFNTTNRLYSTSYASDEDATSGLLTIYNRVPTNNKRYTLFPTKLNASGTGTGSLNMTFWDGHTLNRAQEQLGDSASGWSQPQGALDYQDGRVWVQDTIYSGHYVYHFAYTHAQGSNHVSTAKLTVNLNTPKAINGIYVEYGTWQGSVDGVKEWHLEYHDYFNNQWLTSNYTCPWGQSYLYTNKYIVVDAVRVWLESDDGDPNASLYLDLNPKINVITFVPPTMIDHQSIASGGTASVNWPAASIEGTTYYWSVSNQNGTDREYGATLNFTTEFLTFTNPHPTNGSQVTYAPTHACNVTMAESNGQAFDVDFYTKNGSVWTIAQEYNGVYNGTYSFTYQNSGQYGTVYYWKAIATTATYSHQAIYQFTVRPLYTPAAPTFTASAYNVSTIRLSSISGDNKTSSIMIRFSESTYPADRTSGTLLMNSTATSYDHTGLVPGRTYYYSGWAWNRTDNVWSSRTTRSSSTLQPTVTFNTQTISTAEVRLKNITGNAYTNSIMIRFKNESYPTNRTDGTLVMNSTNSMFNHTGLVYNRTYYYSAWAWNASSNAWGPVYNKQGKTNGPVAVSNPNPANGSTGITQNPTLYITLNDFDDAFYMTLYFRTNASGTWTTIGTKVNVLDGQKSQTTTQFPNQLTKYWWSVNVTDDTFWTNRTYYFTTKSLDAPTNFLAKTPWINGQINLTWTKGVGVDKTIVVRKAGSYPTSISDGLVIYNNTGTKVNDTGLGPGALYYYKAWSWQGTVSSNYAQTFGLTRPLPPTNVTTETISFREIDFNFDKGLGAEKTAIYLKNDFYPVNRTDGTLLLNTSLTSFTLGNLKPGDYLNWFTPKNHTNTIGEYPIFGDPFNKSCDGNTSTKWDLNATKDGYFTYTFDIANNVRNRNFTGWNQTMNPLQRVYGFKILYKDFYNDTGENWNAGMTQVETYNDSWHTMWIGEKHNSGSTKEWWNYTLPVGQRDHMNATEIKISAWTDYITPDIYEVLVGKLGYDYKFSMWSVAEKGGLRMMSINAEHTENRTFDTPPSMPPESSLVWPANGSTGITPHSTNLTLDVSDIDGDAITIYWQTNDTGPWTTFTTTSGVGNGTYHVHREYSYLRTYYWRALLVDDADVDDSVYFAGMNENASGVFHFTTFGSIPPTLSNEAPTNNTEGVSRNWAKVNITISDLDGDTLNWTIHGAHVTTSYGANAVNGTYRANLITPLPTNTWVYWYVNVTDGSLWTNATYRFKTTSNTAPNPPTTPSPTNGTSYLNVYNVYLNVTVSDPESDYMDVSFYWQNGSLIGTKTHIASGARASLYIPDVRNPDWLTHDMVYRWYARANDGSETTQSALWNYHTCMAWDMNLDRNIDILDVSILVMYYGEVMIPGSAPWDINNDGDVSIMDVSILVMYYGEIY
jgi:hypothetical protein